MGQALNLHIAEYSIKLPTEPWPSKQGVRGTGLPYHYFMIRPAFTEKYPALKPNDDSPGLSIKCKICGAELEGQLLDRAGLLCHGTKGDHTHLSIKVTAPRFCLEALARRAYESWGYSYDPETYRRRKEREARVNDAAITALKVLCKAVEAVEVPKPRLRLVIGGGSD